MAKFSLFDGKIETRQPTYIMPLDSQESHIAKNDLPTTDFINVCAAVVLTMAIILPSTSSSNIPIVNTGCVT